MPIRLLCADDEDAISGGGGDGSDESEFVVTHKAKPKPAKSRR